MKAHGSSGQPSLSPYDHAVVRLLTLLIRLGETDACLHHLGSWPALDQARRDMIDELGFGDEPPPQGATGSVAGTRG